MNCTRTRVVELCSTMCDLNFIQYHHFGVVPTDTLYGHWAFVGEPNIRVLWTVITPTRYEIMIRTINRFDIQQYRLNRAHSDRTHGISLSLSLCLWPPLFVTAKYPPKHTRPRHRVYCSQNYAHTQNYNSRVPAYKRARARMIDKVNVVAVAGWQLCVYWLRQDDALFSSILHLFILRNGPHSYCDSNDITLSASI